MSTCLAAIKSLAITSLGIHTGTYTTSSLLLNDPNFKKLVSDTNVVNETYTREIINKLNFWNNVWATLSTISFSLCYFGAPYRFKHPYLIYSMVLIPLNNMLNWVIQKKYLKAVRFAKIKHDRQLDNSDDIAKPIELIDESIIDLGNDKDKEPGKEPTHEEESTVADAKRKHVVSQSIPDYNKYLWINSLLSALILAQSIVGVYGEGYWG